MLLFTNIRSDIIHTTQAVPRVLFFTIRFVEVIAGNTVIITRFRRHDTSDGADSGRFRDYFRNASLVQVPC